MHHYRRARHGWCAAANRSWSAALSGDGSGAFPGRIEGVISTKHVIAAAIRRNTPVLDAPRDTP